MVEDAPPYWIYLPRNLSNLADLTHQWNSYICTRPSQSRKRFDLTMAAFDMEPGDYLVEPDRDDVSKVKPLDEKIVEIFGNVHLDPSDKNCRSDYSSDEMNSYGSVESQETIGVTTNAGHEVITLIVSSEDSDSGNESTKGPKPGLIKVGNHDLPPFRTPNRSTFLQLLEAPDPYEDEEFDQPKLRRSTSLKTNKTPPGTPRRKKVVRFADAFGLDLESVKHILNKEDPPKIPASAISDLKVGLEKEKMTEGSRFLQALFSQPGSAGFFVDRVKTHHVSLENAMINGLTITGTVRVSNIGFHKCVKVRFTMNKWTTFTDILASYVQNSCDGATDRFCFTLVAPSDISVGMKFEFAICYEVENQVYWDNNFGTNYVFECYAKSVPTIGSDNTWLHFL